MKRLAVLVLGALMLAGCNASSNPTPIIIVKPAPTTAAEVPPDPTVEPDGDSGSVLVAPAGKYAKLSARDWRKLVKSPDASKGKGYVVWACVTQFDAATGDSSFRGQAAPAKADSWYLDTDNAFFVGDASKFTDTVQDDVVQINATNLGSYSYDTQNGGNTTVPLFQVDKITRKGSCK